MQTSTEALLIQLKALGDPTRLRLAALCRYGECSVSELTRVLGQSQPRISQQLKQLCNAGLLERFRDGKRVFYRIPAGIDASARLRQLLGLIPDQDPVFEADLNILRQGRGQRVEGTVLERQDDSAGRALHRAILDLTVTAPVGDLLDVGCGRGAILKLLASRANRAVGVDIDANARQIARAELMLAGIPNCSLRKGDMYRLPFADLEFNTIIIDDVLMDARDPVRAMKEARRLLRPGGRLFILESVLKRSSVDIQASIAKWSKDAELRLAPARLVPGKNPVWLVSVATAVGSQNVAA
ncbi:MAG: metalloregulator ArsR/SmtB family transcription factor [Proteobacteria bacterium]|nr:metalloregulator ArsR/SmtB family transcription factor [Pseudomonadota bacterium]MDA0993608.1 metalloregulator ArsR/SmtB family transcription factor [Pseudomonadota bacterium]